MPSDRKFRRTTFTVTVISEGDYNPTKLRQIADDVMLGPHAGTWGAEKVETLGAAEAAAALDAMGSEPGFFDLTPEGEDARVGPSTLYVNADREVPMGAVVLRDALGRDEDGRTLDAGLFWYYETRAGAEAAAAKVRATPYGFDCTIKEGRRDG